MVRGSGGRDDEAWLARLPGKARWHQRRHVLPWDGTFDVEFVRKGDRELSDGEFEYLYELYLNVAEWGDGVFGAEAAARHHFGVGAAALNAEQAAWLAVILPSPRRYERGRLTPYLSSRVTTILGRMGAVQIP